MWSSGYDIEAIIKVASDADNINPETRDETNKYLVAQLHKHINYHRNLEQSLVRDEATLHTKSIHQH